MRFEESHVPSIHIYTTSGCLGTNIERACLVRLHKLQCDVFYVKKYSFHDDNSGLCI